MKTKTLRRLQRIAEVLNSGGFSLLTEKAEPDHRPPANPPPATDGRYEWGWFEPNDEYDGSDFPVPVRGSYGVRQGYKLVCLTGRFKADYERALSIAATLNLIEGRQGQHIEEAESGG